jgi:hypothetical protein
MDLTQRFLTNNNCYKAGKKITVKGLMIHSTGANNPNLSRYVDDPALGKISSSHWNQPKPGGRDVCVHGFIGKDQNGKVRTYQTLPWNHRGWHAGGKANDTHIGVEICEDDLKDPVYFNEVYHEAVELFAYLLKNEAPHLTVKDITTHCDGYKAGIASNHGDVMHWFPKHGKSMETFRADIQAVLNVTTQIPKPAAPAPKPVAPKPVDKPIVPYPGVLNKGSKGKDVQRVQHAVGAFEDGYYGDKTVVAVREYQKRHKLTVDGIVGPKTWNMMF